MHQRSFQNLVFGRNGTPFKNMAEAVGEGIIRHHFYREFFWQSIRRRDDFSQCPFLEETDLAELLVTHFIIRCALNFFRAGLVDHMGNFLVGQFATEFCFLPFHRHVALLRAFREPFDKFWVNPLDFKRRPGALDRVANLVQPLGEFVAIHRRAVVDGTKHIARLQCLPTLLRFIPGRVEQDEMRMQLWIE